MNPSSPAIDRPVSLDAMAPRGQRLLAWGLTCAWLCMLFLGLASGRDKLVVIGVLALGAMLGGWFLAERFAPSGRLKIAFADGLAAGAMIASACVFLLPSALAGDARGGGLGVAAGLVLGVALDRLMRPHEPDRAGGDSALVAITLHAAAAGAAMGLAYGTVPSLSVLLGIVIIAHKLPAGYALARSRQSLRRSRLLILAPSYAVGLVAIPVALWVSRSDGYSSALWAGLATGVFLHVGLDFARQPGMGRMGRDSMFIAAAALAAVVIVAAGLCFP